MAESDFIQTMKDWRRMCDVYSTNDDDCCKGCPMLDLDFDEHGCDAIFSDWAKAADWKKVEDTIDEWAAEHPEPVYETWLQFVKRFETGEPKNNAEFICWMGTTSIPADMAEKLGIEPKEG